MLALVFSVIAAFTVINQTYDYYPTLARLLGKNAANFTDLPELQGHPDRGPADRQAARPRRDHRGDHPGDDLQVPHRPGLRLPAARLVQEPRAAAAGHRADRRRARASRPTGPGPATPTPPRPPSPNSTTGRPRSWSSPTTTANDQDTECSNSVFGNAETYLVKDVPAFMQANFNAAIGKHSLAVAGLSAGGTCATMLALRNPKIFSTFASYSGYASPTYHQRRRAADHRPALRGFEGQLRGPQPGRTCSPGHEVPRAGRLVHRRARATPSPWPPPSSWPTWPEGPGCRSARPRRPGDHSFLFWAAAFRISLPVAVVAARADPAARRTWPRPLHTCPSPESDRPRVVDAHGSGTYAARAPLAQR